MTDTMNPDQTLAPGFAPPAAFAVSRTRTIEEAANDLADYAGHLRNLTEIVTGDVTKIRHRSVRHQLNTRVETLLPRKPTELLDELADLGFGWRDIARMVGVSVPALRRWRNAELPTGENRRAIAQLLAFAQIISEDHMVFGPASWMEVPVVEGAPTTRIDLYAAGHLDVVLDLATQHCTPEAAMDAAEPGWRDRYRSDWETAIGADGQPYIRLKPDT